MVGRSLLALIGERDSWLRSERALEFVLVGAINTRRMLWNEEGLAPVDALRDLASGAPASWDAFAERLASHRGAPLVFLDCTASEFISRQYGALLRSGAAVVTPNKIANTLDFAYYKELKQLGRSGAARYRYATTVGAATPMLRVLEDLRRTGDTLRSLEGVLSGTLSYVLGRVNRGEPFSEAVRGARQRGYTEPHPAADLSGEDVARKLLILVREGGYALERDAIDVEPLVEGEPVPDPEEYLGSLGRFDAAWRARADAAAARRCRLVYLARFDGERARVGVVEVPEESALARLRESENGVHYYTDRHARLPLVIQGAGAGADVTARGVLADLIDTALACSRQQRELTGWRTS
jgi:aspartokinase/homoserine dehydrogenase 1